MENQTQYISLQEATQFCPYSQDYLRLRARQGKLKAVKFGRNWVTKKEWLEEYLKSVGKYQEKLQKPKAVLPPENLLKEKLKSPALRSGFALALIFVFLATGIVLGKEDLYSFRDFLSDTTKVVARNISKGIKNVRGEKIRNLAQSAEASTYILAKASKSSDQVIKDYDFFSWLREKITTIFLKIKQPFEKEEVLVEKLQPETSSKIQEKISELEEKIKELEERPAKEIEVERITKIEPIKEITRELIRIDDRFLKDLTNLQTRFALFEKEIKQELARRPTGVDLPPTLSPEGGASVNTLGTITTGTWQGSIIEVPWGGTGLSQVPQGYTLIGDTAKKLQATSTLFISQDGKVGIATTSPAYTLEVIGQGRFSSDLRVGGNMIITGTTTFSGNLLPDTNLTYDLGSTTKKWRELYVGTTTIGSTITIGSSAIEGSATTTLFTTGNANQLVLGANGSVGIGTTTPAFKLDVNGAVRAVNYNAGINIETLTADKTLDPAVDKMYQYFDPGTANRIITLATTTALSGDRFVIRHNGAYNNPYRLQINQDATALDYIYAGAIKEFIFDGTNWISAGTGAGEADNKKYNVAIGYNASGYNRGAAVGYYARGEDSGAAVGYLASGYNYGVAVGYNAFGYDYGAAVGRFAYGYNSGAAVGYNAFGYNYGAAVGRSARGMGYGAALGYYAGFNIDTTADRYNTLVGAYSGYQLTTGIGNIILGYQSGYDATYSPTTGSKNILIGFQAGTPSNDTSNFLNIGNLIFATGVNTATGTAVSTGNVGIGTTAPAQKLHVVGTIRQSGAVNCGLSSNASGDIICTSDITLKDVKGVYEGGINELMQIDPIRFNFKGEDYIHVGFSGQNVQRVLPEATPLQPDGHLGLDSTAILALAVNSIKDQQKQIEELKLQLSSLGLVGEEENSTEGNFSTGTTTFIEKIKQAMSSLGLLIENGIAKVKELFAQKIVTKQICLEGEDEETLCVDKDQLKQLLQNNNTSFSNNDGENNGGGENIASQGKCDADNLNLCLTETDCANAGGYWYNGTCNAEPEPEILNVEPSTSSTTTTTTDNVVCTFDWQCTN